MQSYGSGFIPQLIYSSSTGGGGDAFGILTENSLNILTETGFDIDIEH